MVEITDAHGQSLSNGGNHTRFDGVVIEAKYNSFYKATIKHASVTATTAWIYDYDTDVLLGTATFVSHTATFAQEIKLIKGNKYKCLLGVPGPGVYTYRAGASNAGFPIERTNVTFTAGLTGISAEAPYATCIESVVTAAVYEISNTGGSGTAAISKNYPVDTSKNTDNMVLTYDSTKVPEKKRVGL